MKVSKFIKVDKDVLLEYIYDDNNLIGEIYKVVFNIQDNIRSYASNPLSPTNNTINNQLFLLDKVDNKYGIVNSTNYPFLQEIDYPGSLPIRHDILRFHFPINYTFQDKLGMYIKLYTFDFNNIDIYELSNFYFDITNLTTSNLINFTPQPFVSHETLWGKMIEIQVPSIYAVALQRDNNNNAVVNSLNANLTNNFGLSTTSPIFIDFHYLTSKDTINNITTYTVNSPRTISLPQVPEFENLALMIEESNQGDFYNIYGMFNGSLGGFADFIDKSFSLGKRYFVEYVVTMYEENIKGKTQMFTVTDNFNEAIEFRPIIKFSTTTAIIDVEMRLIDAVDNSTILRRASYGMLQDQVSKYALNLSKINIANANKPKIYNLRSTKDINTVQDALSNLTGGVNNVQFQQISVPYPVFQDRTYVVAKSESVVVGKDTFFGIGKMKMVIYPFDNVITIIIAEMVKPDEVKYMDLNNNSSLKLVFKNPQLSVECRLFSESESLDLENGVLIFKINNSQISDIRKIYNSNINVFYITSTTSETNTTTIIYSGLFTMYDSNRNVNILNENAQENENTNLTNTPSIIEDNEGQNIETAIVTRRQVLKDGPIKSAIDVRKNIQVSNLNIRNLRL